MPYLFVSDGAEAEEFDSNYFWYDVDDPASLQQALEESRRHTRRRPDEPALPLRALVLRGLYGDRPA